MNEVDPKNSQWKLPSEADELSRMERPLRSRPSSDQAGQDAASGKVDTRLEVEAPEEVKVLHVDKSARLNTKSFSPDVAEILDKDEEESDPEESWGDSVRKYPPIGWFVLAGLLITGLAMWAALSVFRAQPNLEESKVEKKEVVLDKIKETKEVRKTLSAMEECARGYLQATTVDEKLAYVRHPKRVKPLMEKYYQSHQLAAKQFRYFKRTRSMGLNSLSFIYGQIELEDGGRYSLLLEQMEDGSFRADWESDVCYMEMDWDKYIQEQPTESMVMRVYIERDVFYAYQFSDESKYNSYRITTRDTDGHVFGFVERGSKVAMDLDRFLLQSSKVGGVKREPVMLKLRFPQDGQAKKCVVIEQFVAPRWTYTEDPGALSN